MKTSHLNNRIELWGMAKTTNELGRESTEPKLIKKVWAKIMPRYGSINDGEADTEYSNTQFKIRVRRKSCKPTNAMWIVYEGERYNIKFVMDDFIKREYKDLYCNKVTE